MQALRFLRRCQEEEHQNLGKLAQQYKAMISACESSREVVIVLDRYGRYWCFMMVFVVSGILQQDSSTATQLDFLAVCSTNIL